MGITGRVWGPVSLRAAVLGGVVLLASVPGSFAAEAVAPKTPKVDMAALTRETQKVDTNNNAMKIVWWMPAEYWQIAKVGAEVVALFRPYVVVAVVDGTIGVAGAVTYKPEPDTRSSLKVVDRKGVSYAPLEDDQISGELKNFLDMMKPVLVNTIGPMGKNMNFYVFPGVTAAGEPIADPKAQGAFAVKLGDREFRWRLPLGSLLPPKTCPKCHEECSGAWDYCPWCGAALPKPAVPAAKPVPAPDPAKPAAPAPPPRP